MFERQYLDDIVLRVEQLESMARCIRDSANDEVGGKYKPYISAIDLLVHLLGCHLRAIDDVFNEIDAIDDEEDK